MAGFIVLLASLLAFSLRGYLLLLLARRASLGQTNFSCELRKEKQARLASFERPPGQPGGQFAVSIFIYNLQLGWLSAASLLII